MQLSFCTLFDSNYLTRGLAMYRSLERTCKNFHLYIFAFDAKAHSILQHLELAHATIISLTEFEDVQLLAVKKNRTIAEYCWTSTSSTILYCLEHFDIDHCTYLDADLYFFQSPLPLFDELADDSILLTEHRYSPQYNKQLQSGKYCVQFVTFKKNEFGMQALTWWRERCLEWCYARYEDGKFGDQLYLEDWTKRFTGVHELQHLGGGLAPWNIQQYSFSEEFGLQGKERATGKTFDVIFYHFHYVRFFTNGMIELGRRELHPEIIRLFYKPYIQALQAAAEELKPIPEITNTHGATIYQNTWKTLPLYLYRKWHGIYNVFHIKDILN